MEQFSITQSHSSGASGSLFGLAGRQVYVLIAGSIICAAFFITMRFGMHWSLAMSSWVTGANVLALLVVLYGLMRAQPKGHTTEFFSSVWASCFRRLRGVYRWIVGEPVGFFVGSGGMVYEGGRSGGVYCVAMRVDFPIHLTSSVDHQHEVQDAIRHMESALREEPGLSMQVNLSIDSKFDNELVSYYESHQGHPEDSFSIRQSNSTFAGYVEQKKSGTLFRESTHIWLCIQMDPSVARTHKRPERFGATIAHCQARIGNVIAGLKAIVERMGGKLHELGENETFALVYETINPESSEIDLSEGFDRGLTIGELCCTSRPSPKGPDYAFHRDGLYHDFLVLKQPPRSTWPGLIRRLTNVPILGWRICVNLKAIDTQTLIRKEEIERRRMLHNLAERNEMEVAAKLEDKDAQISRWAKGEQVPIASQHIVHVWAETREHLLEKMSLLKKAVHSLPGAEYWRPVWSHSGYKWWYSTWPGNLGNFDSLVHTLGDANLADLLPIISTPTGFLDDAEALYHGFGGGLIGVRSSVEGEPQQAVVCGNSGSGKSTFMANLLAQTEPFFSYTCILDQGNSLETYAHTIKPRGKDQ